MLTGAQWWLHFGSDYPTMQAVAQRILPMRPSSTNVERVFSAMGQIHTEKRNKMDPKTVGHAINVYMNSRELGSGSAFAAEVYRLCETGKSVREICEDQLT